MSTNMNLALALTSSPSSPRVPIVMTSTTTAKGLFDIVVKESKIPATALKLIFRGRIIPKTDDVEPVAAKFKLEEGSVIHCMGKPVATSETADAPGAASAPAVTATPSMSVPVATGGVAAAAPAVAAAGTSTLLQDLHKMQHEGCQNVSATYLTALKTLAKVLDNVAQNPQEEKYRSLKLANAAFQKRLGGLKGSDAVLVKCGFVKAPEAYKLEPSAEKWNLLQSARGVVQVELARISAQQHTPAAAAASGMGAMAGAGGMGSAEMNALAAMMGGAGGGAGAGAGGMPPLPPGMDMNRLQQMMNDPSAIASMLSNPMVQQMVENDPRFAGNPQMRQSLDAIRNNPGMADQLSQMMSNPAMRQQMQAMQSAMGMGGAGAGGMGGAAPAPAPGGQQQPPVDMQTMQRAMAGMAQMAQQQQQNGGAPAGGTAPGGAVNANAGGGNDAEMTEEEMIQQAIERSLRDQ